MTPSPRCDSDTPSTRGEAKIDIGRQGILPPTRRFYAVRVKWLRFPRVVGVIVVAYFLVVTAYFAYETVRRVSSSRTPPRQRHRRRPRAAPDRRLRPACRPPGPTSRWPRRSATWWMGRPTSTPPPTGWSVRSYKVGDAIEVLYDPSQSRTGPPSRRGPSPAAADHGRLRDGGGGARRRLDPHPEPRSGPRPAPPSSRDAANRELEVSLGVDQRDFVRPAGRADVRLRPLSAWQTSSRSIPGEQPGRHADETATNDG